MSGHRYPPGPSPRLKKEDPRTISSSASRRIRRLVEKATTKTSAKSKPAGPEKQVATATEAALRALVAGGYSTDYETLRAAVLRGFASAFARARGMNAPLADSHLGGLSPEYGRAFVDAIRMLDCSTLEPEHFGHVHEQLTSWRLDEDGQVASSSERRGGGVHFTPSELTEPIVRRTLEPLLAMVSPERTLELRICDPACGAGAFLLELVRQLGQRLVDAGIDGDILVAKRLVAVHCAYGVDSSQWAVASAKIALWLECRADRMPPDWLDDNIKRGDALVGLKNEQIEAFHWKTNPMTSELDRPVFKPVVEHAMDLGRTLRVARMSTLAAAARGAT